MEITRKFFLKGNKPLQHIFTGATLVVDINTSLFCKQLQNISINNGEIAGESFQYLVKEIRMVLEEIVESLHPTEPIVVNLNFSNLIFPLHIWYQTLDYILVKERVPFPYHIFVTEQTLSDRQDYMDNNINLLKWTENLVQVKGLEINPFLEEYYLDDEIYVKSLLMNIFEENNLTEEQIEALLSKYHNVEDIVNYLTYYE